MLRLADGDSSDCVTIEAEFDEFAGGLLAEIGIDGALDDAEVVLGFTSGERLIFGYPILAALRPTCGEGEGGGGVFFVAGVGRAFVEKHGDVRTKRCLDVHGKLWSEHHFRAVEVGLETHAFLGDFPSFCERPDLEATRIGEHWLLPGGKIVQATHFADELVAGAEPEVVGVSKDDL